MAANVEVLAARVGGTLPPGLACKKRMFGAIAFPAGGNRLCRASRQGLMVRVGAAAEG
ncbi:MAG: hypothetical protein HY521_12660 [Proteobacteria bacterium]|nr:hypothetical protein [Pseudomonadota bacterium]